MPALERKELMKESFALGNKMAGANGEFIQSHVCIPLDEYEKLKGDSDFSFVSEASDTMNGRGVPRKDKSVYFNGELVNLSEIQRLYSLSSSQAIGRLRGELK